MVLSWLNGGKLLQATNLTGPWVTNQSATGAAATVLTVAFAPWLVAIGAVAAMVSHATLVVERREP